MSTHQADILLHWKHARPSAGLSMAILILAILALASPATAQSAFCHVTDGQFTECPDAAKEWSDVPGTEFKDSSGNLLSVLYADQADLDPLRSQPTGAPQDTLMLAYDEVARTVPLGPGETVHVHFLTAEGTEVEIYDVFIGTTGIKLLINGVEEDPAVHGAAGAVDFGFSPNSLTAHVIAEFQIALDAAGGDSYSPDPAFWNSSIPPNPPEGGCQTPVGPDSDCDGIPDLEDPDRCDPTNRCEPSQCPPDDSDCDGIPNPNDRCPCQPGPLETGGCPQTEPQVTTAADIEAKTDGRTVVTPRPIDQPPPSLCERLGLIVDSRVPCDGKYKNHGDYVKRVAQLAEGLINSLLAAGIITLEEAEALQSCVVHPRAQSDCPPTKRSR